MTDLAVRNNQLNTTYLESLSLFAAHSFRSTDELIETVLTLISHQLGLRTSFLTHIFPDQNVNHILASYNQPDGCDVPADVDLPLVNTYCSAISGATLYEPLIINDTHNDPVFHLHPAAQASPHIASFIGVPIVLSSGEFFGTLCAVDREIQHLTSAQADLLVILGRIIATQLEKDRELEARHTAEAEQARLYEMAQSAVREREALLAIASHEIKNPLSALIGYVNLLQRRVVRDQSLGDRDQQTIKSIATQAERINQMLSNILDVSRLEQGDMVLHCQVFDLAVMVRHMVDELQPTLTRHTIHFTTDDASIVISGDQPRLEQVFRNLLSNAVKYSPDGGVINVDLRSTQHNVSISVRDHGIGIPASALPKLFQRFYRAPNSSSNNINGFGIGLFVVQHIISLHDGTINVSSVEGEGSTFTVVLPLAQKLGIRD
ncbi:MAG: GAF domain-containing sensor histidine kinase [Herpetosiphon sp.]|nr:GAF domain-containing sensor histidine kinase [Herpetosiphon sp.]